MIVLQVNGASKSFGAEPILTNIKLEVKSNEKVALVGRNGVGKSTLLKMITGDLSVDSGEIIIPKDIEIGYLSQHCGLESNRTIWQEMIDVFSDIKEMEKMIRNLELKMADPSLIENQAAYSKLLNDYDQLQIEFEEKGGYRYEADIRSVLHGLQFSEFDYKNTVISALSGGQKTRLALAKLLLKKPELLILDEPTNHLDIETISWLEQYLYSYTGAILIVSHDRYFLDKIVSVIYELSRTQTTKYIGNYSKYLVEKENRQAIELKEYEKQQADIAKAEDFIQKNIARASTTKRAQSRQKQLEKMVRLEKPLGDEKSANFSFNIKKESGNNVLAINHLSVSYTEGENIFTDVNMHITKQESVAIVGPNGIGKSTLLKAIINKIPYNGSIELGTNVSVGYYDQEQANLTSKKTVINELWDEYPNMLEKDIRSVLGCFLFSGEDVFKSVVELSGGEKARLALAKLMLQKANFLILDEPTNHLDLDSKEILENALINYPGTILFVSHDRYFINRLATKVIELSSTGASEYLGDYDYYIEKKNEQIEIERLKETEKAAENEQKSARNREDMKKMQSLERKRQRRIQEIEALIDELEKEIKFAEEQLNKQDIFEDYQKAAEINESIAKNQDKLESLLEEWENLQI
ncbi:multidrug ABC transporter ATP-binding protein [Pueribacillus theae]|uniref:Multidrug ABC transporter ATP-binding protein n=1 Tax=Pueribacillus theae TaxID=2171751 RepID=A0A2U1JME7_9BACI|nr:ABC-F family ATP-binding cassette domain-containing protein [Pueribacillus theae]PWA06336.1 multidrug ABC transporter ATP-binding protein [Pueribacillus theae]